MSFFHHGTMRKYTAALLNLFNDLEIQYKKSDGVLVSKNIPIKYSSREKSKILDKYTSEQLLSGNYNILPKSSLSFISLVKSDQRTTNKNLKISTVAGEDSFEFMYNSVPYEFMYQVDIQCRGMNEATMIVEQIAPKFNPTVNIDIWDSQNLHEPTRIPVKLLDITIETEEYEELSSNIVIVSFGLSLMGNLYPPIKEIGRIKDFKVLLNTPKDNELTIDDSVRKVILGWDVDYDGNLIPESEEVIITEDKKIYPPSIISIISDNIIIGDNEISVIYDDKDNLINELTFNWEVIVGDATIEGVLDTAVLTINSGESVEVEVTITDIYGNYSSLSKIFNLN